MVFYYDRQLSQGRITELSLCAACILGIPLLGMGGADISRGLALSSSLAFSKGQLEGTVLKGWC